MYFKNQNKKYCGIVPLRQGMKARKTGGDEGDEGEGEESLSGVKLY